MTSFASEDLTDVEEASESKYLNRLVDLRPEIAELEEKAELVYLFANIASHNDLDVDVKALLRSVLQEAAEESSSDTETGSTVLTCVDIKPDISQVDPLIFDGRN